MSRTAPIPDLSQRLRKAGDAKTKAWWENYVKDSAPFLGVKMPAIRRIVHTWHEKHVAELDSETQLSIALSAIRLPHTEEKLAGTLLLKEILKPAGALNAKRDLPRFASLFDDGHISDWNVCDWFCMKVLGPLIEDEGRSWAGPVAKWRDAENLWRARASLVAFVRVAADPRWQSAIAKSCAVLIRRPERFAKTSVGWILREVGSHDATFVRRVIEVNLEQFSTESLTNATKGFAVEERREFLRRLKESRSQGRET